MTTSQTRWALVGVAIAALPIALLFLHVIYGPLLSFSNALIVSAGLLALGLLLRGRGGPGTRAAGSVLVGIGATWLAFVGGLIALVIARAGSWGY